MEEAFPIVVVIGLAIFGMFWIAGQSGGDFGLGGDDPNSMLLFSADPGKIGSSNEDFRTIRFGEFTAGELRGDVQAYTSDQEEIKNGLFTGEKIEVYYNATQPGQGQVSFEVLGRESTGKIYVNVNDKQVFKAATITGATPEINISQEHFKPGINKIEIGTTQSELLEEAVYSLEEVEVTVEDRKFHAYKDYFQIYDYELSGFRPSNLTFQIPVDGSRPVKPLEVEVNDKKVFLEKIGRSTQQVELTPANADLSTGYNTIEFKTEGESRYTVENAELQIRYSVNVQSANRKYSFELDEEEVDYAEAEDTKEMLRFQYTKTTENSPIQLRLNNQYTQINPRNGLNTVEITDNAIQEENTLNLDSNETFTVENLQLVSEKKTSNK